MPALSKAQQKFMALVHQYKKGELSASEVSPEVVRAAKSISSKDAKDFASTETEDLPDKKANEHRLERFKLIIRKEVIQNLKDGNYNRDIVRELFESGNK